MTWWQWVLAVGAVWLALNVGLVIVLFVTGPDELDRLPDDEFWQRVNDDADFVP